MDGRGRRRRRERGEDGEGQQGGEIKKEIGKGKQDVHIQ